MLKKEEKKLMILNAATECFSQNGYEKTTLDDIGGKVRLNKASLYYYYSSKEDLFCDVIYSEAQRFREEVRSKAKAIRDVEARVVFFLVERTRFYRRLRYLHELTLNLARKIEPMFVTLKNGIRSEEKMILQDIINEGVESGEIRPTDSAKLADVLLKISSVSGESGLIGIDNIPSAALSEVIADDTEQVEEIKFTTHLILQGAGSVVA